METFRGKIISVPATVADVILTDEEGYVIKDEEGTLVWNKEKGVFRIIGWSSKMQQIVCLKSVDDGIEYPYAPISELKRLFFEYKNERDEIKRLPIIKQVDYEFLNKMYDFIIDAGIVDRFRCNVKYYEVDNTEEARKNHNDGESQVLSASKAIYYAELTYTPFEQWDNIIAEALKKYKGNIEVKADLKAVWNYLRDEYYPPTKINK